MIRRVPARLLLTLIVLSLSLAACAPAAPALELPQSYTSTSGEITLNYPTGWTPSTLPDNSVLLVNREELMADPTFQDGDCGIMIAGFDQQQVDSLRTEPDFANFVKSEPVKTSELLAFILNAMVGDVKTETDTVRINGQATTIAHIPEEQNLIDSASVDLLILEAGENNFLYYQPVSARGKMDQCSDTYLAIAESLTFTPQSTDSTPAP